MISMKRTMQVSCWMSIIVLQAMAGPGLYVERPHIELGDIYGPTIEHTFALENRGDSLLVIKEIDPGCDACMTYRITQREVQPGKAVALKVKLDTSTLKGRFEKFIALESNAEQSSIVILTVAGNVLSPFAVYPPLLSFVASDGMEVLSDSVFIEPAVDLRSPLSKAVSSSERFVAELRKGPEAGTYELLVRSVPPLKEGSTRAGIHVSSKDPKDPECVVRVSAYIRPAFEVLPGRLSFKPVDEEQMRIVFVRQHTDEPVSVLDVISPSEKIHCEIYPEPGVPDYRIYVYGMGLSDRTGALGDLVIKTDDINRAEIKVPIRVK